MRVNQNKQFINIKPLSVNQAYVTTKKGRRIKTEDYCAFEKEFLVKIKPFDMPHERVRLNLLFGIYKGDNDNLVKATQDVLFKKLDLDDKIVFHTSVEKVIVPRGMQFIQFEFLKYDMSNDAKSLKDFCLEMALSKK